MASGIRVFLDIDKTYTSSVSSRILEDFENPLPGIIASTAVSKNELVPSILDYLNTGMYQRSESFYKYSKKIDLSEYNSRISLGYRTVSDNAYNEIVRVIENDIGHRIKIFSYHFNRATLVFDRVYYLEQVRGLDRTTREISVNPPGLIYEPLTPLICPIADNFVISSSQYKIDYTYTDINNVFRTFTEYVTFENENRLAYEVSYYKIDSEGNRIVPSYSWRYLLGTDINPILENQPDGKLSSEDTYPIVPFFIDQLKVGDISNQTSDMYINSKKLTEKLGLNYDDLYSQLLEGVGESIGKDKGLFSFLYLGACATAGINTDTAASNEDIAKKLKDSQPTINYLIDFFLNVKKSAVTSKDDFLKKAPEKFSALAKKNRLTLVGGQFETDIYFYYIESETISGVIGDIGWCTTEFIEDTLAESNTSEIDKLALDVSSLIYKRQETESTYLKVTVVGLYQEWEASPSDNTQIHPIMAFNEEEPSVITVPLFRSIVKKQPPINRNALIHSSLYFVFNAYQRIEVKWYQNKFWADFLTAAMIILAIPSGGISIKLGTLLTIAGLTAAAYALIIAYLKYVIMTEVFKVLAKELGATAAFVLAVILIAYGKMTKGTTLPGTTFAGDFVLAGNYMWSAADKQLQYDTKEVEADYARMQSEMGKLEKELERAEALLDTHNELDVNLFVNPTPLLEFGQSPSEYVDLRVHTPNPGVLTLQTPSTYVDLMLRLPDINDTLTK